MIDKKLITHIFLLTAVLLLLASWLSASLTFFSSDTGLRFWLVKALIRQNWHSFALEYPARFLDPDLAHVPYYYAYLLINDQLFANLSPILPWLSSGIYAWFGPLGLIMLPIAGGVATAVAIYKIARLQQLPYPYFLFWAAVFTTPILFYSLQLWDHTLGTACVAWAIYGLLIAMTRQQPGWAFASGLLIGFGAWQRTELVMFVITCILACLLTVGWNWRLLRNFALGGILISVSIMIWQYRWYSHPLGGTWAAEFFGFGLPEKFPYQSYSELAQGYTFQLKFSRLLFYVQGQDVMTFLAALLVLLGGGGLVLGLRVARWRQQKIIGGSLLLLALGYLLYLPLAWGEALPGFLTTAPLWPFLLVGLNKHGGDGKEDVSYRFLWLTTFGFLALMLLIWPSFGGTQWGARYLLPAYPLLLLLAAKVFAVYQKQLGDTWQRLWWATAVIPLILAFLLQATSIHQLYLVQQAQVPIRQAIRNLPPKLILTNNPFLPVSMAGIDTDEKWFMYVSDTDDLQDLIPRLAANDIDQFALITVEGMPLTVPLEVDGIRLHQTGVLTYQLQPLMP